ncbi:hypothetical protein [Streptomyces viridochromogenes]|uniref:hypothetical protein n=1 Tax=Streptomyces viridochromogenes TaxID=1938 RepID=UPI00069F839B|nr:hypothetical protein [Streptomyces viridochromogenes]KOG11886.1 hypothetical protein ADK36_36205 [Streptomyces viridochromogenes]KOG24075.1 hypothetical protein ADK35_11885 [Streptomyces viridochromogenes]
MQPVPRLRGRRAVEAGIGDKLGTGSSPLKPDSHGDGVQDSREDSDGDKVQNQRETQLKTPLARAGTDGDALADGKELGRHTSPAKPDTDGDGVDDGQETRIGSDPRAAESAFDVTRSANGGSTTASAAIKGLSPQQVSTFRITELPDDQRQFPTSTGTDVAAYAKDHGFRSTRSLKPG